MILLQHQPIYLEQSFVYSVEHYLSVILNDESEQAQLAKADEAIKKVDIEEELKNLEDEDDDADYMQITDVNKLRRIVKSLKTELRASRTNHLAVSETKTHLEVQTFDLQTK